MGKLPFLSILLVPGIFLTLADPHPASAQPSFHEPVPDSASFLTRDAGHFLRVGTGAAVSPLRFSGRDWMKTGIAAGATALLFLADKDAKETARHNQNRGNGRIFNADRYWGNAYSLLLAGGIYGVGALAGNSRIRETGLRAAEAFVYSGMITGALKLLIGRRRPYAGDAPLFLKPFQWTDNDYQSLPSGHTTVAFAVSTVLAESVDNLYWKLFWFGAAGLTGASRIYHDKHWLSDVFLGAVIGYTVGDYAAGFDRREPSRLLGMQITPCFGNASAGLCLALN